jgi:hypothetical protein
MTPAVTAAYAWSRFPLIADVGGGIGTQLVDILNSYPSCKGILFDRPDFICPSHSTRPNRACHWQLFRTRANER